MTNMKHDQTGTTGPNNGADTPQAADAAAQQGAGAAAGSARAAADSARQQAASAAWQQALARAAGTARAQGTAGAQASGVQQARSAQASGAQHPAVGAQRAQGPHDRQQAPRGGQRQVSHGRQQVARSGQHQTAHQRRQAPYAAHPSLAGAARPQSAGAPHTQNQSGTRPQGGAAPHTQNQNGARPQSSGAASHAAGNAGAPHATGHAGMPHAGAPRPYTVHHQTNPHQAHPARPAALGYVTATDGHGHRPGHGGARPLIAAAAALVCIGLVVLAGCWFFMWRDVTITINGESVTAKVSTPLSEVLDEHDQFGAKPGRLLSVTGEVLSKDGGNAYTVTRDKQELSTDEINQTHVQDGDEFSVTDGADAEEPSTEETVEIAPKIDKKEGGAIQYVSQWGKPGKKRVKKGETSGETVDVETIEKAQDMVVSSANMKPSGGKYVALTFDDGPSSYTPKILKILKEKNAKATFFNLGEQAKSNQSGSKAVVDAGMELASHTMAHRNLPNCDRDTLRSEITKAFDALDQATGTKVQMIRAPYGAFTSAEWARAGDLISCNVLWNIDTLDWERPGAAAITSAVLNHAYNGAIILMHDGGGNREQDVEALPDIIDGLREKGYELVTVSELMKLDGSIPDDVINGTVSMPDDAVLPKVDD